jgi:hypothetical protein
MERVIQLGSYSAESRVVFEWVPGFSVTVNVTGGEVAINANPEGLRSLAQHLMTLAEDAVPDGSHVHLEPGLELEDSSASLVLSRGV